MELIAQLTKLLEASGLITSTPAVTSGMGTTAEKVGEMLRAIGARMQGITIAQINERLHAVYPLTNGDKLSVLWGGASDSNDKTLEIVFLDGSGLPSGKFRGEWGGVICGYQTPEQIVTWVRRYISESDGKHG